MLPPGAEVLPGGGVNPDARHMECVPIAVTQQLLVNDLAPPVAVAEDRVVAVVPDRAAGQKKTKKHHKSKRSSK